MLRAANSICSTHFAVWSPKKSVLERAVCHLAVCSDNKNALTNAFSLACLEIRLRNEEAINSTRNRIYSLKVY